MAINIKPWFKGAIIGQGILVAFLLISLIWFADSPSTLLYCRENMDYQKRQPWLRANDFTGLSIFIIPLSALTLALGVIGLFKESTSILRHVKLSILFSVAFNFSAVVVMAESMGRFRGERNMSDYGEIGCPNLHTSVYSLENALNILLVYQVPLLILLEAYLKSLGDELSFLDYILAWFYHARNCIRYGRQGISFTSSFIKTHVQQRLSKSVRVAQKNDTLFREVELGSRMFGAISIDLFKENIANKYDRHPNDIIRLTKNGNVLISDDADVTRIGQEDFVEVEFEDRDRKLQEINSVILEDSNEDTRIEM